MRRCELVFPEIGIDFLLDGIADAVLEEIQSFFSFGSDGQMGTVTDGLGGDHTGIRQFVDHLLCSVRKLVYSFPKNEIADLRGREREGDTIQHIEHNEFI